MLLSKSVETLIVKEIKKNQETRSSESDYWVNDVLSSGYDLQVKT